jgi:hypothetical protein
VQRWLKCREPVDYPFGTTVKKELKKEFEAIKIFMLCFFVLQRRHKCRTPIITPFGTTVKKEYKKNLKQLKFLCYVSWYCSDGLSAGSL